MPVGKDQLPHIEVTRQIARRFNERYAPVFPEPEGLLNDDTPEIPDLTVVRCLRVTAMRLVCALPKKNRKDSSKVEDGL